MTVQLPRFTVLVVACAAVCGDSTAPLATAKPGVIFTYPVDSQIDVPLGTTIAKLPGFRKRLRWFLENRGDLAGQSLKALVIQPIGFFDVKAGL